MAKRAVYWTMLAGVLIGLGAFLYWKFHPVANQVNRSNRVTAWIRNPADHPEWAVPAGKSCQLPAPQPQPPFVMPTDGYIGYLWDDSFRPGHRHSGIDIFGGTAVGVTPVVAAYPGYLTRLPEWRSAVIVRVPEDPLEPTRQIWLYYTHMANPAGNSFISSDFPPGTEEKYIEAGTFLGYQGNYTGDAYNPSGVHLHFSIVLSGPDGSFLNELEIKNTLDPSPYFGLPLNGKTSPDEVIVCEAGS